MGRPDGESADDYFRAWSIDKAYKAAVTDLVASDGWRDVAAQHAERTAALHELVLGASEELPRPAKRPAKPASSAAVYAGGGGSFSAFIPAKTPAISPSRSP